LTFGRSFILPSLNKGVHRENAMEILKEILRIVTSKSEVPKVLPELDEAADPELKDSLTAQFLQGLQEDAFEDDDDAARVLYGTDKSDQRYRTLKSRIFERLLHSILFLQVKQPEHSEYLSYYYKCTRNLICAQSLMRFASRTAGFHVAQKTLSIAQKYEFTDICLTLAVLMRETVGFWGQRKQFEKYNELVSLYFRTLEAEYRSDALLDMFTMESNMASRTKQYMIHYGETVLQEISELYNQHQSHLLLLNVYRHRIVLAHFKDEPDEIIQACDEAIKYLEKHHHLSQPARLGEFRLRKMMMLIHVRRSQEAFKEADTVVGSFREAGSNWYVALEFATVSAFHSGRYDDADRFVSMATSHRKYSLLAEQMREGWTIYNAYSYLAYRLGLFEPEDDSKFRQFRLSTYLNSVPEESKVKKVSNVLILVSHVYFLILDGDFDAAEKRIEYLKVYGSRYLKEKSYQRIRVFLRLLQALPRNSFLSEDVRADNRHLFELLQATREDPLPSHINEYIPFETMYESLLDFLERYENEIAAA
jgi:hypothetical protein